MNITIKNQVSGIRSYMGGLVTVADGGQTTIGRDFNVPIIADAQFLSDINDRSITLNTDVNEDLTPAATARLIDTLAQYVTDPIATVLLYYSAQIEVTQSAGTAVDTTVWAMRNPLVSPYSLLIEKIKLKAAFDGANPIGDSKLLRYSLHRFSAATPSGGASVTAIKHSSSAPASAADIRYLDTGLTVAGISFENPFDSIAVPEFRGAAVSEVWDKIPFKLAPGEGFAIRIAGVAASAGQSITGRISWSLR